MSSGNLCSISVRTMPHKKIRIETTLFSKVHSETRNLSFQEVRTKPVRRITANKANINQKKG